MSDLTFLVAISFLVAAVIYVGVFCAKSANALSTQIITGVAGGTPVSVEARGGMLWGMWLPYQFAAVILTTLVGTATLEMANHVSGANVKLLAHLVAFMALGTSVLVLAMSLNALPRYSAKLRRDKQRQDKQRQAQTG
jgi:hypothetical protein